MNLGGYADRIARIDLTSGTVAYEHIEEEDARKYLGARGLGVKYVFDNGPTVDPLGPDNLLCFMNGPLTGTEVNMSGRMAIVTKSPLTGTVTDSHHGGWSAARLRWSGFDGLLFKGRSEKPVYAFVEDEKVELRDASDLWGRGVHEVVKTLLDRHGDDVSVITIGPAGENLVRYASFINENDRASGRGGTGCVAGSKQLKAVVVKAKKNIPKPANKDAFKEAHKRALAVLMDESTVTSPRKGGLSVYGTNVLMNVTNTIGGLGSRNSQSTSFANAEEIAGEKIKETILVDDPTCHACPVACKKEVETHGRYGVHMESFEYEPAWSLGANCGNDNRDSIAYIIDLCNDYGMDAIEHGQVLGMAMEASEKELIRDRIGWGDTDKMVELTHLTGRRQEIGNTLAEGTERAAKAFGDPNIAMTVKGMSTPAYDPRGLKGMGVAYATSNRGACHLRAYTPAAELLGVPEKMDPLAWEGKGALTKLLQDLHAVSDSFDLCKFSAFAEGPEEYLAQYNAVTGAGATVPELMQAGERIYNLERHYNNLAGFREGSDYLPKRFTTEPSDSAGSKGHVCELDLMLKDYYEARGWVNGVVPESKLKELAIV
ncbi:MAG TPA: aldehyde ferredoxin oxidoreductase family protein [Dehalococcoidia bacterium]|nr:aldehyde ferredoxin oxidoreductase family protein [Dehalococcoidia bacterium]